MDNNEKLDTVLFQRYFGDAFYDVDVEYVMDVLLTCLKQGEWRALGAFLKKNYPDSYNFIRSLEDEKNDLHDYID